jgi:hypothetical protein
MGPQARNSHSIWRKAIRFRIGSPTTKHKWACMVTPKATTTENTVFVSVLKDFKYKKKNGLVKGDENGCAKAAEGENTSNLEGFCFSVLKDLKYRKNTSSQKETRTAPAQNTHSRPHGANQAQINNPTTNWYVLCSTSRDNIYDHNVIKGVGGAGKQKACNSQGY